MSSLDGALQEPTALNPPPLASAATPLRNDPSADPTEEVDDDLFGHDQDVVAPKLDERDTSTPRHPLEYDEDEQPPDEEIIQRKEAYVAIPKIPAPRRPNGETWVMRMPNFVGMEARPFHPYYTFMQSDHQNLLETENSVSVKLKTYHTVRWRWIKDATGQPQRQTNTRIIRWSDGSLSLRLGKELFDMNQTVDTSGLTPRQSFGSLQPSQGASQSQSQTPPLSQSSGSAKSQGLTYLVAQHPRAQVLQVESVITGHMTLNPTGMDTTTHRMLVRAVSQRHNKPARLRMAPDPKMDPEREKQELMRLSAKKAKKKAEEDGLGGRRRRAGHSRKRGTQGVWSDDEDDGGPRDLGVSEEEGGPDGSPRKKRRGGDREAKEGAEYQEDDFLVADSTDEDHEGRKGRKAREEEEEDPLEQLEIKIESQERRRKREMGEHTAAAGGHKDTEDDMDVESEEDEVPVRRTGASSRKKKRVVGDDDDDDYR